MEPPCRKACKRKGILVILEPRNRKSQLLGAKMHFCTFGAQNAKSEQKVGNLLFLTPGGSLAPPPPPPARPGHAHAALQPLGPQGHHPHTQALKALRPGSSRASRLGSLRACRTCRLEGGRGEGGATGHEEREGAEGWGGGIAAESAPPHSYHRRWVMWYQNRLLHNSKNLHFINIQ